MAPDSSASEPRRRARRDERKRILVVNDTQEILELFNELLGDLGYEVSMMSFAPNELSRVKQAKPDLVIVDFVLGPEERSGWQLIQKIKMDRDTEEIPVIACTAAVQAVREQEGYLTEQGVLVLLKPFSLDQLEVALDKAFALPRRAMGTRPKAVRRNGAGRNGSSRSRPAS